MQGLQPQLNPRCHPKVPWPALASVPFPFPSPILCLTDLHPSSHDPCPFCPPQFLEMPNFIKSIKAFRCDLLPLFDLQSQSPRPS